MRVVAITALLLAVLLGAVTTQAPGLRKADVAGAESRESCEQPKRRAQFCTAQRYELRSLGHLVVNAGPNGSVAVYGWDRDDVQVLAFISAHASTELAAREIASRVHVKAVPGRIWSEGPRTGRNEGWVVSYRLYVPQQTALRLKSTNGGLAVIGVEGWMRLETTNGAIDLRDIAGDVYTSTTNGGTTITLTGDRWSGGGLKAESTNGGITLLLPRDYSTVLRVGTVNGQVRTSIPLAAEGSIGRELESVLGAGGNPIGVRTTNGSISIGGLSSPAAMTDRGLAPRVVPGRVGRP